jgi:predicted nucleotidyltransferase
MAQKLPPDFKEFLKLLNNHNVEYLLIGGHAVGYYGYPRVTKDIDIWIATTPANAKHMVEVLKEFGFDIPKLQPDLFLNEKNIIRLGEPPIRIEVITDIPGVDFAECYNERVVDDIDGVKVNIISLKHLKTNKKATGRHRDLDDLENLP